MTKTIRKPRSDSVQEMIRLAQGTTREIAPPGHIPLEEKDLPFFEDVLAEFARADWTEHAISCAAFLARTLADLEENQRLLRSEGLVVVKEFLDKNGDVRKIITYENVRARAVQTMMGQVLAMRRSLALTGRAKAGSTGDAANKREANKKTERSAKKGQDDLLA